MNNKKKVIELFIYGFLLLLIIIIRFTVMPKAEIETKSYTKEVILQQKEQRENDFIPIE